MLRAGAITANMDKNLNPQGRGTINKTPSNIFSVLKGNKCDERKKKRQRTEVLSFGARFGVAILIEW